MAFNSNASFALEVHIIEHLVLKVLRVDGLGIFEQSVGKCAFTVVDMGNNTKVSNIFHF
jgi:hypothetical protein